MDNKTYLDFDEAVSLLKTTPSTMYKWLQTGKIPGHKLGRQWRFVKSDLEGHVSGVYSSINISHDKLNLDNLLLQRAKKITIQETSTAEKIIWDAYDHGTRMIHIGPVQGKYEIRYRQRKGFDSLTILQEETFKNLDQMWCEISLPMREENMRRLHLHRLGNADDGESLQVRYQKIETVAGPRITLQLWNPKQDVMALERISNSDEATLQTFKFWAKKKSGLIVISGASGSGKTTTMHSMLKEAQSLGSAVFTVENPVEMVIDGINQVEMSRKTAEEFETNYDRIIYSDPDVIALGLGHFQGLEKMLVEKALAAATTGTLVILQWHASSCEEAIEQIQKHTDQELESVLVGVCHQKLVPSAKGLKAIYQFKGKN